MIPTPKRYNCGWLRRRSRSLSFGLGLNWNRKKEFSCMKSSHCHRDTSTSKYLSLKLTAHSKPTSTKCSSWQSPQHKGLITLNRSIPKKLNKSNQKTINKPIPDKTKSNSAYKTWKMTWTILCKLIGESAVAKATKNNKKNSTAWVAKVNLNKNSTKSQTSTQRNDIPSEQKSAKAPSPATNPGARFTSAQKITTTKTKIHIAMCPTTTSPVHPMPRSTSSNINPIRSFPPKSPKSTLTLLTLTTLRSVHRSMSPTVFRRKTISYRAKKCLRLVKGKKIITDLTRGWLREKKSKTARKKPKSTRTMTRTQNSVADQNPILELQRKIWSKATSNKCNNHKLKNLPATWSITLLSITSCREIKTKANNNLSKREKTITQRFWRYRSMSSSCKTTWSRFKGKWKCLTWKWLILIRKFSNWLWKKSQVMSRVWLTESSPKFGVSKTSVSWTTWTHPIKAIPSQSNMRMTVQKASKAINLNSATRRTWQKSFSRATTTHNKKTWPRCGTEQRPKEEANKSALTQENKHKTTKIREPNAASKAASHSQTSLTNKTELNSKSKQYPTKRITKAAKDRTNNTSQVCYSDWMSS